jgi:nucleoid-associated protein YgaU
VLSLALVAACGAALVFGITDQPREPPVATGDATASRAASSAASGIREERLSALATPQAEANAAEVNALAGKLAVSPGSGGAENSLPAFDVARVEQTGEAVIAGRAAPGAVVELLRGGERLDHAVADASGQFVMVPPRLPAGAYELTLRSRMPDGTLATSRQGVAVALNEVDPGRGAVRSPVEASPDVPDRTAAIGTSQDQTSGASRALQQSPLHSAKRQDAAVAQLLRPAVAAPLSDRGPSSAMVGPRSSTTVVSRGDSLWRISRLTYGVGTQYPIVYRANRDHIRDPNRIYPGQVFVLPIKAR